jgi:hypothetical protein
MNKRHAKLCGCGGNRGEQRMPANVTVTVALLVGALSVAGAIFLFLELNDPAAASCASPTSPTTTPGAHEREVSIPLNPFATRRGLR